MYLPTVCRENMRNVGKEGIYLVPVTTEMQRGKSLVRKRRCVLATVGKSCTFFTSKID